MNEEATARVGGPQCHKKKISELDQLFPKCGPRTPKDPRLFPRDPWINFRNGFF